MIFIMWWWKKMLYLILDLLIYNYTNYKPFFLWQNLFDHGLIYNLSIAFLIDFVILKTYYLNIIFVLITYHLIKYLFKSKPKHLITYYLVMISICLSYYLITNLLYSQIIFKNLINVVIINSIFYLICSIKALKNIKLIR